MVTVLESMMLVCFGISWPISVCKSLRTRSTAGKSPIFMAAILIGYVAGILGKLLGSNLNYVLALYLLNFAVVSIDFALYFVNRRRERATTRLLSKTGKECGVQKMKKERKAEQAHAGRFAVENSMETVENLAKSRA